MHEPITVEDLIRMLQRENPKSTIFVPVADLSDVNNKEVRYEKFGCDIGLAIRDDRIYLLASHL
jgi:hypothetical protein